MTTDKPRTGNGMAEGGAAGGGAAGPSASPDGKIPLGQSMAGEVWVWVPQGDFASTRGPLAALLAEGRGLARRAGVTLSAICPESPPETIGTLLAQGGVGRIRLLDGPLPPHPDIPRGVSPLLPLLEGLAPPERPCCFLFPHDAQGRVLAPLTAQAMEALLWSGLLGVTVQDAQWMGAREVLAGGLEALLRADVQSPLVATLRPPPPGVWDGPESIAAQGPMAIVPPPEGERSGQRPPARLLAPHPDTLHLGDAERIVAFGRGAFAPDQQALVYALAQALGAVVGGTRPAADEGHLPFERQIGLTGAIVQPRLYVAVGISGAPYHMVGVKHPHTLVAINKDPDAPIFSQADLGIVGDLEEVIPALLALLDSGQDTRQAMETLISRPSPPRQEPA